jgi:hypothetical protein
MTVGNKNNPDTGSIAPTHGTLDVQSSLKNGPAAPTSLLPKRKADEKTSKRDLAGIGAQFVVDP